MRLWSLLLVCSALSLLTCVSPCFAQQATVAEAPEQTPAGPRPQGAVVRPDGGVQHPDLDNAWSEYDAIIQQVGSDLRVAISAQFDAAAASGNLDYTEKWQSALQRFDEDGEIPSEPAVKTIVADAVARLKEAKDALLIAYESLTKKLTMDKKLPEAKDVRAERDDIKSAGQKSGGAKPKPKTFEFDFTKPNTPQFFQVRGPSIPNKGGLEFPGTKPAAADSKATFSFPLKVTFSAATFPDKNFDCYSGLFVPPDDDNLQSFAKTGIHLHWGCFANKRTILYVFGRASDIKHRLIEAGRVNEITFVVDKNRTLKILLNGEEVHKEVLPPNLRLEGAIRCNGGIGHVIYRSATVVTEAK